MGVGYLSNIGYTETLNLLIVAFCRDYFSRKKAIEQRACAKRTLMEYEYLNRRISDAALEIAGNEYEIYIKEIGDNIGYASSEVESVSEPAYKKTKKEIKVNIAKKLHLID